VVAATAAPGWEPFVLPLVRDPHPLVARRAHLELLRAADREVRGRSLLHLLEARDPVVAYERFCDHDSPAFAAGLVGMLEGEKEDFFREALTFSLWSAFPREVLDRHIDRLLALFLVWDAEERWVYFLARSLVKLDDPRADEALIEAIRRRSGDEQATVPAIIDELLRRGTPIRAPRAREVLEELMRSGKACGEFDHSLSTCRELAAYLLLLAGSQEALHQLLSHFEESEDSPPIFESAPAAILVRLAGILAEEPEGCDARADLHLPGSQRDHNGRGEGEEVAAR
jgi:hypothetical protein